jgi:membrane protein
METSTRFTRTEQDKPLGELVQDLSRQTSTLIRQEMRLAQAELAEKGRHAGKGAGMFGGAGLVALYGVGALIAAAILGLATMLEPWIAAAAIGAGLLFVAGILALTGKKELEEAGPPKPEQAIDSVQRDIETVKARAGRERDSHHSADAGGHPA